MRRFARLMVTAVIALGAAQAAARDLDTWCASITPEFHLVSDLPREAQVDLLDLIARLGPVAEPFLPGIPVSHPSSLKIVVFSRRGDFSALTGKRKFAAFMQPSLQTNRLLVGPIGRDLTATTLHEYAHYLLRSRQDVSLPLWFDEGLASVLGQATFDSTTVTLGGLPLERLHTRLNNPPTGQRPVAMLSRTLSTVSVEDWPQPSIDAFYDWSWLLAHYLYFEVLAGEPIAGSSLERFLAERDGSLPEYLDKRPSILVRTLQRYVRGTPRPVQRRSPSTEQHALRYECLAPFERDLELARAVLVQNPEAALELITPHLATRPDDVSLQVTRARIAFAADDRAVAGQFIDAALALDPENAEANILAADLAIADCLFEISAGCRERWQRARAHYQRGLRKDPNRFDGVLGLGLAYLYTGQPGEAVNYVRVAYTRAPWAALTNFYLGESYRLIGDTRARGYLVNARNWAVLPVWRLLAEESLRQIDAPAPAAGSDLR